MRRPGRAEHSPALEREFLIDNLLVPIHYIIVMIRWTGLAFEFPFPGSLTSTFLITGVGAVHVSGGRMHQDGYPCLLILHLLPDRCSQERLTRGTVTSTMRRAAHPSGCPRCGAGAGCSGECLKMATLVYSAYTFCQTAAASRK